MTAKELRCCAAEALGAFAIVFFGCGAIVTIGHGQGVAGHVGVNIVFGAVVAAMIFALGHVSCAHFNPAVTLGFAVVKRFPWRMVAPYVLAQILGAVVACGLMALLLPAQALHDSSFGATIPSVGIAQAVGVEAVLTFFLAFVIVSVATDARVPAGSAGVAIGLVVMLAGLAGGPLTGCSMNPARSIAPALFAGGPALSSLWIYLVGPAIGGCLGMLAYEFVRSSRAIDRKCPASCCAVE